MTTATACAGINIALIKYWGKADASKNLPAVGSISLTLDDLITRTTVTFDPALDRDHFTLDAVTREDPRVIAVLDAIRAIAGLNHRARVKSRNDVPTASGLASSASGVAALATAAWAAAGLDPTLALRDDRYLDLVRIGSGSAPRSLLGGLVELDRHRGHIRQLLPPEAWDLHLLVARLTRAPKATSSRDGMTHTRDTSPYYPAWIEHHPADLADARAAITDRDLPRLGAAMERSTHRMHACMLAADPPLRYWRGKTLDVADAIEDLRRQGIGAWYTMDAGPHVKVLCETADASAVRETLESLIEPTDVLDARPGPGARLC